MTTRRATPSPAKPGRRTDGRASALRHLDLAARALGWTSVVRDRHRRSLAAALVEGDEGWLAFSERLLAWSRQALEEGPAAAAAPRLAALAEIVTLVRESPDPAAVLTGALDRLAAAVAFENATFFLIDEAHGALLPVATRGEPIDLIPDIQFDLGQGLSSWVARSGRPVLLSDLRGEGGEGGSRRGSFLSVPLVVQREAIGVLNAGSSQAGAFTEADRDLLVAAGAALAAPLLARRVAARADRHPGNDALTGLPNGPAFEARFAEAIERGRRYGEPCAVAIIAPRCADALRAGAGPTLGDDLVAGLGRLLVARSRKSDVVARLAPGNNFAVLLAHQSPERARLAMERLTAGIERHVFPRRRRLAVDAGLAAWPADGDDAGCLIAGALATALATTTAAEAA